MSERLLLEISTPKSDTVQLECDCVQLNICGDKNGRGCGSYGVKKSHANAVFALEKGEITVICNKEIIFSAMLSDGFAVMKDNRLTVTVDSLVQNALKEKDL